MIHLNIYLQAGIVLLVVLVFIAARQMQTRSRWKKNRKTQAVNMKLSPNELAEKHPNELRDMLTNARDIQTINAAYLENPKIRDEDRVKAQKLQEQTNEQINRIHAAILESVEKRAKQNLVTPAHA